ncbi:hypothetical protein F7725_018065 [Dissostichus mawsoni]|uniref:Uncharacterized protein n=1 Tax=Dissostichus mawsoni TaxID=36200 RepID=A0A7J5XTD3_DISMA|nr:hypothetical protein F7725_018065 [Dissostichus mawsoni]
MKSNGINQYLTYLGLFHSAQLLGQNISQHISLCGDLGHQVLGGRGKLLLQGDGILAGNVSAVGQAGTGRHAGYKSHEGPCCARLAVFTGCNANIFYADAPKPQMEFAQLEETRYVAAHLSLPLQDSLPLQTMDMIEKVITETEELMGRVERELADALKPYTDDMKVQIRHRVEQVKQELAPYAESLDTEPEATLEQKSEELKQSVKDLQLSSDPTP